ncbi:hypothetical protein V8C42DRAFT_349289 [Trichoderma barbatum]
MFNNGRVRMQIARDVPAIYEEDREACAEWLASLEFPKADKQWDAIKRNWKEFLTATLPPGRNSMATVPQHQRRLIQQAFWELVDGLEVLSERWPLKARVALNQHAKGNKQKGKGFESLAARWLLGKRRRFQSMWTGMICFLVYSSGTKGRLEEMGLALSGEQKKQLGEVASKSSAAARPEADDDIYDAMDKQLNVIEAVEAFMRAIITANKGSTTGNNAALLWTAVLVRSAVSEVEEGTEGEDFISRGQFRSNILPLDASIRDRVEAMTHYSKVMVLDKAFKGWVKENEGIWVQEVCKDLDQVDNEWLNEEDGSRPAAALDGRECSSDAWVSVIQYLGEEAEKFLGGRVGTFTQEVGSLQQQWKEESRAEREKVQ